MAVSFNNQKYGTYPLYGGNGMERKIKGINAGTFRFLVFLVFIIVFSETAFAQFSGLSLNTNSDLRLEYVYSNKTLVGYNLFVRKKAGIESVMLTDQKGIYALRSLAWNDSYGKEIRQVSGKPVSGPYSDNTIISSTPIHDWQFDRGAFMLFIPSIVVYGSQASAGGPVFVDVVMKGLHFNIKTFDNKFYDSNKGKSQNNLVQIKPHVEAIKARHNEFSSTYPSYHNADAIKREVSNKISYDEYAFLDRMSFEDLKGLLIYILETGRIETGRMETGRGGM